MKPLDPILERFSRAIDLPAYVGQMGYVVDEAAALGGRLAVRDPSTGQRLDLKKDPNGGGWSYSDPERPDRRGAAVDLLMERGLTSSEAADHLIACCDPHRRDDPVAIRYREYARNKPPILAQAIERHILELNREVAATRVLQHFGIRREALDQGRFGKLGTESEVAVALGEPPVAWFSKHGSADRTLVITERPLDAMAYEQTRGGATSCYIALGNQTTAERRDVLEKVLRSLPPGMSVVVACGGSRGRQLAKEVRDLAPQRSGPPCPPPFGNKWGDYTEIQERHRRSLTRGTELHR